MTGDILVTTFQQLRGRLTRLAQGLLHDDEQANDALQEAFCRLWVSHRDVGSPEEATALSITTVRNFCISELRAQHPQVELDEAFNASDDESVLAAEQEATLHRVQLIIRQRLTPLQRDVLESHDYRDESVADIAQRLHMQETAVRMHLSRARKTIRDIYKEHQP